MMKTVDKLMTATTKAGYKGNGFPSQTVTIAEKETDEWMEGCMDFMKAESRSQSSQKAKDLRKYQYLAGEYDYAQNNWSRDPLNLGVKKEELYGATDPIQHFPVMNSPLNTISGERINRPV